MKDVLGNDDANSLLEQNPTDLDLTHLNALIANVEKEQSRIFEILKKTFKPRFPELEAISLTILDYVKVVQAVGHEIDIGGVDFTKYLPRTVAIALSMPASITKGQPLSHKDYQTCQKLIQQISKLENKKTDTLQCMELEMNKVAPNITAIVGAKIAAQLVSAVGALSELVRVPAGNILVIGRQKQRELSGFSLNSTNPHSGFISQVDLVKNTPALYKRQAERLVANKIALAARFDLQGSGKDASFGQSMRTEIIKKLEKLDEPAQKAKVKPIPPPPTESSKKRGGRRARKAKELYAASEIRQMTNRMEFGKAEKEIVVGSSVVGLGELGSLDGEGKGRMRSIKTNMAIKEHLKKEAIKANPQLSKPIILSKQSQNALDTFVSVNLPDRNASEEPFPKKSKFLSKTLKLPRNK